MAETASQESAYKSLTDRQRLFVDHYLGRWSARWAAKKAGYKQPHSQGPRLLAHVGVRAAIEERLAEFHLSANEVLARIGSIATGKMDDFLTFPKAKVKPKAKEKDNTEEAGPAKEKTEEVETGEVELDLRRARARGKLHLVKKFKKTVITLPGNVEKKTVEVELYSAQEALNTLAKVHGLTGDKSRENFERLQEELFARFKEKLSPQALAEVLAVLAEEDGAGGAPGSSGEGAD